MNRVFSIAENSLDSINHVAVAIRSADDNQRHIGILHRGKNESTTKLLHLAWHHCLKNEDPIKEPIGEYLWVSPKIHAKRAIQVAALCRNVWEANGKHVPYAFSPPSSCFDAATGQLVLGSNSFGLTCATFVLEVFRSAGVILADTSTWKSRADDIEWQTKIILLLQKTGADNKHIEQVRKEIGAVRFRPLDVAGAAAVYPPSADFENAARIGNLILVKLDSLRK